MGVRSFFTSQTGLFARLSLAHFFVDAYTGFMLPILPVLATHLGFSKTEAGILLGVSSLSSALLQPFYGHFTDKARRINFMVLGLAVAAGFISLIGYAPSYWALAALVLFGYMGAGLYHPTATTCVNRLKSEAKNAMMGTFMAAGVVGFAFGMYASAFLVEHWGLSATIFAMGGGLLGMLACVGVRQQVEAHQPTAAPLTDPRWKEPITGKEKRLLALLCFIGVIRGVVLVGVQAYLPFLWTEQKLALTTIGTVVALSSLIGGPTGVLGGFLADKIGEKRLMFYSFLPGLLLFPAMLSTSGWTSFALFIALCGCLEATIATLLVIAFREVRKKPNTISGIGNGLAWGFSGLLMPLFGWACDSLGVLPALQLVLWPLLGVGTLLTLALPSHRRIAPAEPLSLHAAQETHQAAETLAAGPRAKIGP